MASVFIVSQDNLKMIEKLKKMVILNHWENTYV